MSGNKCPSKDSAEKYDGSLNIKEEPYDPEYDRANQDDQNTSFGAGQHLETTLKKSLLHVFPTGTNKETKQTGCEQSALYGEGLNASTFPVLPNVKSELEKYESVRIKEEHNYPGYEAVHRNTEFPSFTTEDQDEGQDPLRMWTVKSSHLVPLDGTGSHTTQTSSVHENINIGTQSVSRDEDGQDINTSSMEVRSGTSCDIHMSKVGQVKRGHQESAVEIFKRQKQGHVTTPKSTIVKQECEGKDDVIDSKAVSDNRTPLKCNFCTSTFRSKLLLEAHHRRNHGVIYITPCRNLSTAGQVKRGHQASAASRKKQGNATTSRSTAAKQESGDEEEEDDDHDDEEDYDDEEEEEESSNSKEEENLTCKFCSKTFQSKLILESHQCREATYYCKICYLESTRPRQYSLMTLPEAELHFYHHFHPVNFEKKDPTRTDCLTSKCLPLPEELQGKTSLLKYKKEVGPLKDLYIGTFQPGRDSPYHCGLCGATFSTVGARVRHISKAHLQHKNRKCDGTKCEKLFYSSCQQDRLLRHMFGAHCDFVRGHPAYLKCKFCTVQFRDRTDLEWHFYWHMQPAVKFATAAQENFLGQPPKDSTSEDASKSVSKTQFRCTICSFESVESVNVQLYTAAEALDHLAWHWLIQLPPEIRKNPNVLNFEKDSDIIYCLYMTPHAPDAIIECQFCGRKVTVEGTYRHLDSWHKDHIRKPHRCMCPECKHLQFTRKQDFFGHMFLQHVSVLKRDTVLFSCQICKKTFQNRRQVEWHCYVHRVRLKITPTRSRTKLS